MFISYNKVSSLGQKKVDLFKKLVQLSLPSNSTLTPDNIIATYTSEEDHFIVAKLAGNSLAGIVAFRAESTEAWLDHIAVLKKFRNHGYGKMLVNHVFEQGAVQRVCVECDVETATFFEKIGFKVFDQLVDNQNRKRFKLEKKIDKQTYF